MSDPYEPGTVKINCRVDIKGFEPDGEVETFWIVEDRQANLQQNKLPAGNPLARALQGASVGKNIPFQTPAGKVNLTVVDVSSL